jgi:RNA polymerase-binding transcription factor DksA
MAKSKKSPVKKPSPKPVKKPKKIVKKAAPAKSTKPAKVLPAKKASAPAKVSPKLAPAKPAAAKAAPAKVDAPKAKPGMTAADLKRRILERKSAGPVKAISFSLDEVREIAKKNETSVTTTDKSAKNGKTTAASKQAELAAKLEKAAKPNHIKPASLSDILGFNPSKGRKPAMVHEDDVPEKFRRYYKQLIELRTHVLTQLGEHTEETLMKSAKDDSGDLSGYGQHMADAGTDTFDRDFALSLVSSEQEALSEIEAAIKRIHDGSYGVCEITQKPISKERLHAVPFTRYSAEAQKQVERHSHRAQQRGGLFGDAGEEDGGGKLSDDGGDDE